MFDATPRPCEIPLNPGVSRGLQHVVAPLAVRPISAPGIRHALNLPSEPPAAARQGNIITRFPEARRAGHPEGSPSMALYGPATPADRTRNHGIACFGPSNAVEAAGRDPPYGHVRSRERAVTATTGVERLFERAPHDLVVPERPGTTSANTATESEGRRSKVLALGRRRV